MHVVLVEPEIPQNTGSISRVCAGAGTHLHLVGRLGFSLADRYLKRAGLDYWPSVRLHVWSSLEELLATAGAEAGLFYYSAHAKRRYTEVRHSVDDYLVFGKESVGLPAALLEREAERTFTIPHAATIRSLNLANAVSVVLYEALRQTDFAGVETSGEVAAGAQGPAMPLRRVG
jgi:tRNA (cytidine/uridine-2'-O-)-methyltransferase